MYGLLKLEETVAQACNSMHYNGYFDLATGNYEWYPTYNFKENTGAPLWSWEAQIRLNLVKLIKQRNSQWVPSGHKLRRSHERYSSKVAKRSILTNLLGGIFWKIQDPRNMPSRNEVMCELRKIRKEIDKLEFSIPMSCQKYASRPKIKQYII